MNMVTFIIVALVIALLCFAGIGGYLLPMWGIEGPLATGICGGVAGGLIAVLYVQKVKKPDGA